MKQKIIGFVLKVVVLSGMTGSAVFAETITGWVDYAEQYSLSVGVDGIVDGVAVKEGERVLAGTVLLSLKDDLLKADLAAAKSELSLGQEEMKEATRSFDRDQALFDEGSLATVELDLARIKLLRHQARVDRLKAEMAAVKQRLDMSRIVAPFAGAVVQLNVAKGQRMNMHAMVQPMIKFASSALRVNARVPAGTAKSPALSSTVQLGSNGEIVNGVVRVVRIEDNMQYISISIEAPQTVFQPGQSVEIVF